MPNSIGSGGGVNNVGVRWVEKNRKTITASLCLMFAALATPTTGTSDWSKGQHSLSERSRAEQSVHNLSDRVTFILAQVRSKWHRFQEKFLNILILIACVLLVLQDLC